MDLTIPSDQTDFLESPSYGLLLADIACWKCKAQTPTAAIWVPSVVERNEEGDGDEEEAALLQYVQGLDALSLAYVQKVAPWLRPAYAQTSDTEYLAHHCVSCDALQGDYFVFNPDGPYWPQDDAAIALLKLVPGEGPLRAQATPSFSGWMSRIESA